MFTRRSMHILAVAAMISGVGLVGCTSNPEAETTANSSEAESRSSAAMASAQNQPAPTAEMRSMTGAENRLYYPTGNRETSMLLLERTGPVQARVGKPYNYTITVTNLTNAPLQGVTVQEMLPKWFTINDAPATQPAGGATVFQRTYAFGELKAKETRTLNLAGVASETGALNSCTSVTCNPTLCSTAAVINPQIKISKQAIGSGDLCEIQTVRYTVTNTGTGDIRGVRIDDQLASGLAIEPGGATRVAYDVGTLTQGQSRTVDIRVKAARAGEFSSVASAIADDEISAKSEATAMAIKAPKLEVTVKAPEKEYLGSSLKYEVTVKNVGTAIARNPSVRIDPVGPGAVAQGTGREDAAQLAAARQGGQSVGELAPGASKTITVAYNPRAEGDLRVNAVASDMCAEAVMASATTHIDTLPALLLSAVDDHDPIRVGENVTYTITVLDQGFGSDKNIRVIATLPDGEQYVSSGGASAGTAEGNKVTFAPVATIAPKQTLTWTLTVKATKIADVRLRVDMSSDSFPDAAVKMEPTRLY